MLPVSGYLSLRMMLNMMHVRIYVNWRLVCINHVVQDWLLGQLKLKRRIISIRPRFSVVTGWEVHPKFTGYSVKIEHFFGFLAKRALCFNGRSAVRFHWEFVLEIIGGLKRRRVDCLTIACCYEWTLEAVLQITTSCNILENCTPDPNKYSCGSMTIWVVFRANPPQVQKKVWIQRK